MGGNPFSWVLICILVFCNKQNVVESEFDFEFCMEVHGCTFTDDKENIQTSADPEYNVAWLEQASICG